MTTLGPKLARTPLHLFWLLDTSGSMEVAGKIDALNDAMRDAVPALRDALDDNPGVDLQVRAVAFDHDARWHVATPVPIEEFEWVPVSATPRGTTELGRAIHLVTEEVRALSAARRGLPPALVLVSDGRPTDLKRPTFGAALRALVADPWGQKASRIAIGIGRDADLEALRRFIGHDEIPPLVAHNAHELAHYVRWASTVLVQDLSETGGEWGQSTGPVPEQAAATVGSVPEQAAATVGRVPTAPAVAASQLPTELPTDLPAGPAPELPTVLPATPLGDAATVLPVEPAAGANPADLSALPPPAGAPVALPPPSGAPVDGAPAGEDLPAPTRVPRVSPIPPVDGDEPTVW